MSFLRRLKLYGFGFLLGLMIVYAMFGTRSCTTPNELKVMELVSQRFELSQKAQCKLKCLKKNEALLKLELKQFEVDYSLSSVRKQPCGEYYLQPQEKYAASYNYKLVAFDCDSVTRINDLQITSTNTCNCY